MGIGSSKPQKDQSSSSAEPPTLTVRNITVHALELVLVERFDDTPPAHRQAGGFTHFFHFKNATTSSTNDLLSAEPTDTQDVHDVHVPAFETKPTPVAVAGPNSNSGGAIRLTFQTPLITQLSGAPHRYVLALAPGSHHHDAVHTHRHKTQSLTSPTGGPIDLTAVYVASARHLTLYSSAALPSWMATLPDAVSLAALSIPGTHNSPTCYVALPSVRCQAVGVRAQLDNGVRFLDVRVSVSNDDGGGLALVHSVFPISLTGTKWFADVLVHEVYAFLYENPSETVLLSVKREGTGRGTDQHLSRHLFHRYCQDRDEPGQTSKWFTEPRVPTLGEARGKIVLIRRFQNDEALLGGQHGGRGWGIDAAAWPDNCADGTVGSGLIRVQDFYEVQQSHNIDKKIDLARCHLEKACERTCPLLVRGAGADGDTDPAEEEPLPLFINFLTASNFFNASCWPERIAAKVNPSIIEYLCLQHAEEGQGPAKLGVGDAGTGIVVTDWVGLEDDWDLLRCVVGWNARLQLKD